MLTPIRDGIRRAFTLRLGRAADAARDADDELASHLEERAALLEARGMSPDEARAEARRRLGGSEEDTRRVLRRSAKRRERRTSVLEWLRSIGADVRYVGRGARREPGFFAFVVLTLALGIGANAAMFGVVDRLLVRRVSRVPDPDRVVRLFWTMQTAAGGEETTPKLDRALYANVATEARVFSAIGQFEPPGSRLFGPDDNLRIVPSTSATPSFFTVLGVRPAAGRFFVPAEGEVGSSARVVVLGYAFWQAEFGGDPSIVGRSIQLGPTAYSVIGVAPRGFNGVDLGRIDLWFPLIDRTDAAMRTWKRESRSSGPRTIARLKPGITLANAGTDATTAHRRTYTSDERNWAEGRVTVGPLHFGDSGTEAEEARIAKWLAGLSAVVLLVACANIVNLLLARSARRRREMAVRLSLGAGRARLIRLLMVEALALAAAGGVTSLAAASAIGGTVRRGLLPTADWDGGLVNVRVLAFTAIATLVTGIAIGVFPAARASATNLMNALKSGTREGGGHRSRIRTALTVSQAALAMLLLSGAGVFVASFEKVRAVDLGIQADRVVEVTPSWRPLPSSVTGEVRDRERERRQRFIEDALVRVRALAMVERAAIAEGYPFSGASSGMPVTVPGRDSLPRLSGDSKFTDIMGVSVDYFATVGTRLLRGRVFNDDDRAGGAPVAIVDQAMAAAVWPGEEAIGKCLLIGDKTAPCTLVVGVVQNARRHELRELPAMHVYVPISQSPHFATSELLVRLSGDAAAGIPDLRRAIASLDPGIRYVYSTLLRERIDPQFRTWRVGAMMFSLFAALALVMAAIGLFSVVAYLVEQRRHEIGVRKALGADSGHVVGLLVRGAVGTTVIGILIGAALSLALGGLAQPLLFETDARNPAMLAGVASVLLGSALAASGIPALRARRVDPMIALRDE